MKWHEEVVSKDTVAAAERLAAACGDEFYLAGGTALALQNGHRISLDLDLFSANNRLSAGERDKFIEHLKKSGSLDIRSSEDKTCHLIVGKTFVSLFHYPYQVISLLKERWHGLAMASVDDICAMKLSAVLGRGAKKDFIDLYFICHKLGFEKVFSIGKAKFPQHGNFLVQAARALIYFDDAESEPMPKMLIDVDWDDIKKYFTKNVPKFFSAQLK